MSSDDRFYFTVMVLACIATALVIANAIELVNFLSIWSP